MNTITAVLGVVLWLILIFYLQDSKAEPRDTYTQEWNHTYSEQSGDNEVTIYNPDTGEITFIEPENVYRNSDNTEVEYLNYETGKIERIYIED